MVLISTKLTGPYFFWEGRGKIFKDFDQNLQFVKRGKEVEIYINEDFMIKYVPYVIEHFYRFFSADIYRI